MSKNSVITSSSLPIPQVLSPELRQEIRDNLAETEKKRLNDQLLNAVKNFKSEATIIDLINQGADIEARSNDGRTPLNYAASRGNTKIVKFLLRQGAKTEAINNEGSTPLILATIEGHAEIIEFLLKEGANIEAKNNEGFTSFILAAMAGNAEIIKLLIYRNANFQSKNKEGKTALNYVTTNYQEIKSAAKIINMIIVAAASSENCQVNNEQGMSNWSLMQTNELNHLHFYNFLNKEISIFLAATIAQKDETAPSYNLNLDLRKKIIKKFNSQEAPLTQNDKEKIEQLRNLKKFFLEVLAIRQDATPALLEAQTNGIISILGANKNNLNELPILALDLQTTTFLAAIISPEESNVELRQAILEHFNFQNPERPINLEEFDSSGIFTPEALALGYCVFDGKTIFNIYCQPETGATEYNPKSLQELTLIPASKQLFEMIGKFFKQEKADKKAAKVLSELENNEISTEEEKVSEIPSAITKTPKAISAMSGQKSERDFS